MMQGGGGDMSCDSTCVRQNGQISISEFNFPWGDLGKPGDHCQSARPCFQTAQQEKKCQQAAFNVAHLPALSADVPGGLSERYYQLLWMSCVLPAATYMLLSDNSRDASRRR